jgi:hypothetical protein
MILDHGGGAPMTWFATSSADDVQGAYQSMATPTPLL